MIVSRKWIEWAHTFTLKPDQAVKGAGGRMLIYRDGKWVAQPAAAKHFVVWGANRDGMGMGHATKAAYVGDQVMLISQGSIDRNQMPPGFQRFLTPAECEAEGVVTLSAV